MIKRNIMRGFWAENKKHLIGVAIATLFLSLLPVFETVVNFGFHWDGAPPSYIDDNYYYVRMKEIVDGRPLLGNPYLKEHADDIAPAFVFPDWIYALPLLGGVPLVTAISINFSVWSLVFTILLYMCFRRFGLPKMWSALGTFFCYTQVYLFILRPVSMQLVYPVFLLFLMAWFAWQDRPENKRAIIFLGAAAAFTFYDYAYLWQIIVVFYGLMMLNFLREKDRKRLKYFLTTHILTFVLLIPFILFTLKQVNHPYYWETMVRTGLVATHLPTAVSFYTGGWVCALAALLFLSLRWMPELRKYSGYARFVVPFSLVGIAMSIVSVSNIITGKELEIANHIERFIKLWLAIGLVVSMHYFFAVRKAFTKLPTSRQYVLALFGVAVIAGNFWYVGDLSVFLHPNDRLATMRNTREYMPAFTWLDTEEDEPQVVWVDTASDLTTILPIYTKHYLLFANGGILHLVSDDEIQERYLTARYLREPTVESIALDTRNFSGVARGSHLANTHNRGVKICRLLHLGILGYECGSLTDSVTLNTPMAEQMFERYTKVIKPNIEAEIKKFNVVYIMKDKKIDTLFHPELLKNFKPIYEDQRSVIYKNLSP